jgi:hypothetical protein
MYDSRGAADRIAVARLAGTVRRHVGWKAELSESELKAAVDELREITKGIKSQPS